jgi:hypothetical protein
MEACLNEARFVHPFVKKRVDGKGTPHEMVLGYALAMAIVATLDGYDPRPLFRDVAKSRKYKDPRAQALRELTKRALDPSRSPTKLLQLHGTPVTGKALAKLVVTAPSAQAFDIATIWDSPLRVEGNVLALPLAYCAALERGAADGASVCESMRQGTVVPRRNARTIYERHDCRSEGDVPKPWNGFDALAMVDDVLVAYYYLGSKWIGPLVFHFGPRVTRYRNIRL